MRTVAKAYATNGTKTHGRRYEDEMKMLAEYVRIIAGRKAYDFLQANTTFLPSVTTLRRIGSAVSRVQPDPYFVAKEAREFYTKIGYDGPFLISDDCTALLPILRYDACARRVVGFPVNFVASAEFASSSCPVSCVGDVYKFHSEGRCAAGLVHVQVLLPLFGSGPAFVLSAMPTNNNVTASEVKSLWTKTWKLCEREGLSVAVRGHDGDARNVTNCLGRLKDVLKASAFSVEFAGGAVKIDGEPKNSGRWMFRAGPIASRCEGVFIPAQDSFEGNTSHIVSEEGSWCDGNATDWSLRNEHCPFA